MKAAPLPGCRYCGDPEFHDGEACRCIEVRYESDRIVLVAPLVNGVLNELRRWPGRKYHGENINSFPAKDKARVWLLLRRFYAHCEGSGPHGTFLVPTYTPCNTRQGWGSWQRERDNAGPLAQDSSEPGHLEGDEP